MAAAVAPSHCWRPSPSAAHVGNLERFGLQEDNIDSRCSPVSRATTKGCREGYVLKQVKVMATTKIEKTGVSFSIGRQIGPIVIEVRPHHETISALKGAQLGFELLNGITLQQAKKILDVLNENVIGAFVITTSDDKTEAASG